MVRPENIRLVDRASRDTGGSIILSGRVIDSSFHGARRSVTIDVGGSLMKADLPAMAPLSELVTLNIDERTAWALAS